MEALAAVTLLRERAPDLRIRVVNVVDLMALQPQSEHPHGLPDEEFDMIFPVGIPIVFAFHGYPWVIHRLTYRRHNHDNLHVRGYKEEGTTTTPFDMCVLNNIDRFQLDPRRHSSRVPRHGVANQERPNSGTPSTFSAIASMWLRKRRRPARNKGLALAQGINPTPLTCQLGSLLTNTREARLTC
jgi:hypothetical protein